MFSVLLKALSSRPNPSEVSLVSLRHLLASFSLMLSMFSIFVPSTNSSLLSATFKFVFEGKLLAKGFTDFVDIPCNSCLIKALFTFVGTIPFVLIWFNAILFMVRGLGPSSLFFPLLNWCWWSLGKI
uniref:Uncharacterized protein n=2 Tax=Cacopsylla melanoneura TaxID=428564 RepID=A0A8D9EAJ3_9HEMI